MHNCLEGLGLGATVGALLWQSACLQLCMGCGFLLIVVYLVRRIWE